MDSTTAAREDVRQAAPDTRSTDDADPDLADDRLEVPWTTDWDEWPPHFGAARLGIP